MNWQQIPGANWLAFVGSTALCLIFLALAGAFFDDAAARGIYQVLREWQTLAAAIVASIAAYVAFQNTTRSLQHAERLEKHRRVRKHVALRAVLPLALAGVIDYAERSAHALNELVSRCDDDGVLPAMTAPESLIQRLPPETLETLADFIEYRDAGDVRVIEATIAWIQIHDSRLRRVVKANRDPSNSDVVLRAELEGRIIDAASIYAGAAAIFDYARRRQTQLPQTVSWVAVRNALRNMRFWDEEHPELQAILRDRETRSEGPFEMLETSTPAG